MTSKGGKIPSGSKVSVGSKVSSGQSEKASSSSQVGMSYWELQIEAMSREQLRKKAKGMDLSTSGSKDQLKNRIRKELIKEKPVKDQTPLQKQQRSMEEKIQIERKLAVLEKRHWDKTMEGASSEDLQDLETEMAELQKQQTAIEFEITETQSETEPNQVIRTEPTEPNQPNRTININNNIMTKTKIDQKEEKMSEMDEYVEKQLKSVEISESIDPIDFSQKKMYSTDGLDLKVNPVREKDYTQKGKIKELRNGEVVVDKKGPRIEEKDFKRVWIVEKVDTAKPIQEAYPNDAVHVLGGNPFGQPSTVAINSKDYKPIRVSKDSTIEWRNDRSFGKYFYYPKVSKNQEVIIVTDEDSLGQYINREVAKSINSQNVKQYAIEGMKAEEFQELLTNTDMQKDYALDDAKAYAQEWFVEADSTVNTTIISNMLTANGFYSQYYDDIIKDAYGKDYSKFKQASSLSRNVSLGRIELGIGNYVLGKQLSDDVRAEIIMDTEIGIQTIETSLEKAPKGDFNVKFEAEDIRDLKILSTDQTIQYLINNLKISGVQAEELINRLYRQGYLSYPRTESNQINLRKEDISSKDLAEVWNSYLEGKYNEKQIAKGINELNTTKGKSGIIVLRKSPYKESDLEYQVLMNIAKLNTLATTKAKEVSGRFILEDEKRDINISDEILLINTEEFGKDIGKVVDVKILTEAGVSEIDLYSFLRNNDIGTPSTRTNKIEAMLKTGFLVRRKNRYLVDERLKFFITENNVRNKYAQIRYTNTPEFDYHLTKAMYQLRNEVEQSKDPEVYSKSYIEVQKWLQAQFNPFDPILEKAILEEIRQTLKETKKRTSVDQEFEELIDDEVEVVGSD